MPFALAALFGAIYTAASVARHLRAETTGFDLGIFNQAVRAYAEFRAPVAELKGPGYHLLGDHFHPILALLSPFYRLFPSPVTLLVAQALVLALSVVPVTRMAVERLGKRAGLTVGVCYGLSWGLQQAVGFDFHEVCFAVPLLAFSLAALVRRQWTVAALWALPLLLVKEDLPFTVAAIGCYIAVRGSRAVGFSLAIGATLAGILILKVVIPAFNPDDAYAYGGGLTGDLFTGADAKLGTVVFLLAPTLFVALRSPLILLALPTLGWRFLSDNPSHWGTEYHYSAFLMPIVFVSFVDGVASLRWRARAVAGGLAITLALTPFLPLRALAGPASWRTERALSLLEVIPDGAEVAASNRIAPQLTARCRVFLYPTFPTGERRPAWVAVFENDTSLFPQPVVDAKAAELGRLGYRLVASGGGILILHRQPPLHHCPLCHHGVTASQTEHAGVDRLNRSTRYGRIDR